MPAALAMGVGGAGGAGVDLSSATTLTNEAGGVDHRAAPVVLAAAVALHQF